MEGRMPRRMVGSMERWREGKKGEQNNNSLIIISVCFLSGEEMQASLGKVW